MKHFTLFIAFIAIATFSYSQVTFSVSPGMVFNGGTIGYKFGKFNAYAGIQYFGRSVEMTSKGKRYNSQTGDIIDYDETNKVSLKIYMPNVGIKYFLSETKKVRPYINAQFFIPIVKLDIDLANERYFNSAEYEKQINGIRMWAVQAGFGAEYFFDENFSLGGELGFRTFNLKMHTEEVRTIYDMQTNEEIQYTQTNYINLGMSNVYSKISLNYYF